MLHISLHESLISSCVSVPFFRLSVKIPRTRLGGEPAIDNASEGGLCLAVSLVQPRAHSTITTSLCCKAVDDHMVEHVSFAFDTTIRQHDRVRVSASPHDLVPNQMQDNVCCVCFVDAVNQCVAAQSKSTRAGASIAEQHSSF